ncbi:MAG: class I SAM-dependent methyltransferase [Gammaproteobacteria bacterium]
MSSDREIGLPAPAPDALLHSERLRLLIGERIGASGGWMSFADYMQLALYAPGLGYYSAGATKFGGQGDFVTAPMISPLFSRTCARRLSSWLTATGTDAVLEFGPGTGQFAVDALSVLAVPESPLTRYALLEVSADLRARQAELLKSQEWASASRVIALDWLNELPRGFCGIVFANEVLDALPCERFVVRGSEWWRLGVGLGASGLEWRVRPADGAAAGDAEFIAAATIRLKDLASRGQELPEGYCGEWHPWLESWLNSLAAAIERGAVLIADYGLPRRQLLHPDRKQGGLRCHYRHHAHGDPFVYPGLNDITTWVDFSAVAEAASQAGFEVTGFTTQAAFLLGSGIEREMQAMTSGLDPSSPGYLSLARGARTLLLPGEMGESVKFMLLTKNLGEHELADDPSFVFSDLRGSL